MHHLRTTDERLFGQPFTPAGAAALHDGELLVERVNAFVAHFGRLQGTVGDKLLPALLHGLGHTLGPFIEQLRLLDQWGWLLDAETWLDTRLLRERLIYEYAKDPAVLADTLHTAHERVSLLVTTAGRLIDVAQLRRDTT